MKPRLIVLGCVKTKLPTKSFLQAQQLYDSQLWRARLSHATSRGLPFVILSAELGILSPTDAAYYYERTIDQRDKDPWTELVRLGLWKALHRHPFDYQASAPLMPECVLEVHAGRPYVDALAEALGVIKCAYQDRPAAELLTIEHPVEGMQIGEQLSYYKGFK